MKHIILTVIFIIAILAISIKDPDTIRLEKRIDLSKVERKLTEAEFRLLRLEESNRRILAKVKNLHRGYIWFPRGLRDDTTEGD